MPDVILSTVPIDDLAARIAATGADAQRAALVETLRETLLPEFLDGDAVCRELSLSDRQLRHLRTTRRIPFVKIGPRVVQYPTRELFAAVRQGLVPLREGGAVPG